MKSLPSSGGAKGMVLIIVLASLVLLSLLMVSFLNNVGTELTTSKVYATGASVKLLSQSAVNIVQSEINDATRDGNLCWASQPGMIRTFDASGQAVKHFKLYSDDLMVGNGAFSAAGGLPPNDWPAKAGVYVDLNEPVNVNGTLHFPILPGNAADYTDFTPSSVTGTVKALAPINAWTNMPQVSGFWIKNAPVAPGGANQAPMPVKWLYVLRDGTILTPDSALNATGGVTFTGSGTTPDNGMKQIVGRIAFWTDDDTSKVNVNTAGEGATLDANNNFASTVWDTPRFRASDYSTLTTKQPVQNEFQRYAGHPSTVSLSAVFGNLVTDGANSSGLSYPENIFPLTPRIEKGGSKQGTIDTTKATGVTLLNLKVDRLYDTVDEFIFQKNRTLNSGLLANTASLDRAKIEQAQFFLTANSRAPDVNLFNRPRVSMWPVSGTAITALPHRSPKDQLIAFCSTVNDLAYYFQRMDANDPSIDLPQNPSSTGLGRNRELMEYLRNQLNRDIPGFGGSFGDKYDAADATGVLPAATREVDQILTQIFDYVRCTNIRDQSIATPAGNPVNTFSNVIDPTATYPRASGGAGQVVPIVDPVYQTRGFGRFPTLQQAALIFYACKDDGKADTPGQPPVSAATQAKAFFVVQFFDPAMGYPLNLPYYKVKVSGLGAFLWNSSDPNSRMYNSDTAEFSPVTNGINLMQMCGGVVGWRRLVHGSTAANSQLFSTAYPDNPDNLPYAAALPAGLGLTGIRFKGGPIKVEIFQKLANGSTGALLQSISFNMPDAPSAGFPLPALPPPPPTSGTGSDAPTHRKTWEDWANRWNPHSKEGQFPEIISRNDVIRAVIANPGDMRLVAARTRIDDTGTTKRFFDAHPRYTVTSPAENMAHNLAMSNGQTEYHASMTFGRTGGMLVALSGTAATNYYDGYSRTGYYSVFGNNYGREYDGMNTAAMWSDVPTNTGVFTGGSGTVPGDWDNGVASIKDGAYINKPDEGDTFFQLNYPPPYFENSYGAKSAGETFFTPNRMIPSPGMLGSLPTGVLANKPWQTLHFRPGPAGHPGLVSPPDHLIMDLFTMPVVEPYAISEPLSTAGRINMNYRIVPFSYITRSTGLHAVLRGTQVISVPDRDASIYKYDTWYPTSPVPTLPYRMPVDVQRTLTQFETRFDANDVFRSASEICTIDLVPKLSTSDPSGPLPVAPTRSEMDTYWRTHRLTGDNSRERPYTNVYPLLTTKSNTYTVHFRVQTLQKARGGDFAVWNEKRDTVTGEYRGSQTIERYVDANNATDADGNPLPNFADVAHYNDTLNPFYKWRVVSTRQFAP